MQYHYCGSGTARFLREGAIGANGDRTASNASHDFTRDTNRMFGLAVQALA
jgi:hypothetical protein